MSETIQLKKDDQGNTVQVVTTNTTQEVPLSADELRRQIKEHSDIVNNLQAQLEAVVAFESSDKDEASAEVAAQPSTPIVDQDILATVTAAQEDTENAA